ncbi:Snakin-2, partial [Mucuna pruriens]
MPLRELLLMMGMLMLVCLAKVSSDVKIEKEGRYEQLRFPHDPLIVRDGNRRLMQDIVMTVHDADCGGLCNSRCSAHSRPNVCHRACNTCCMRCKCVPPGTSGNRELCGTCYTDMTTHGNKTKCP